jgi:hypothetical protein
MMLFSAPIYKLGINPVVVPPDEVLVCLFEQAGRNKGPIPVRGRLSGAEYIQTLVKYSGAWRLYINGEMLRASGLSVGETADIEIEFDPRAREVPMPKAFADALKREAKAQAGYESLTPSRQKEILLYLSSLKTAAALARNVDRAISQLRGDRDA